MKYLKLSDHDVQGVAHLISDVLYVYLALCASLSPSWTTEFGVDRKEKVQLFSRPSPFVWVVLRVKHSLVNTVFEKHIRP